MFVAPDAVLVRIERAMRGEDIDEDDAWRVVRVDVLDPATDLERRHMVSLREPITERYVDSKRTTTKWKLPSARRQNAASSDSATTLEK